MRMPSSRTPCDTRIAQGAPKPRPLTAAERAAAREAVPPVRVVVLAFSGEQLTTLVDALGTVCPQGSQVASWGACAGWHI